MGRWRTQRGDGRLYVRTVGRLAHCGVHLGERDAQNLRGAVVACDHLERGRGALSSASETRRKLTSACTLRTQVLLLAVLTSEPYITFPSPSTLFSSAILLPTVTGAILLVSTSANLGGVVLSVLRVLTLGAVWSQLRARIGETRDSERIQSAASRLAMVRHQLPVLVLG